MRPTDKNGKTLEFPIELYFAKLRHYGLILRIMQNDDQTYLCLYCGEEKFYLQFSAYLPFKAELTGADVSQLGFDFLDALPELYPLLDDRRMYMKTSNMDLPPEALASITHLWNERGDNGYEPGEPLYRSYHDSKSVYGEKWNLEIDDLDMRWPFTKAEMVGLRVMYTGATISHSNESMLRAFLSLPVTNCELLESGDIGYALKWSDWCMTMNVDDVGLHFELFHSGQQPSSDFAVVTCAPNCQIEFNWPDREKGKLRLTWPKIEKCFGISKVMFKARKVANEDPLMALRDCHEKVRESDKLWASARPGFSVKDFLNSAASKAGNFPATAHTMR